MKNKFSPVKFQYGSKNNFLTVVVPYFRLRFLHAALASLAEQTDKNFKVFIGDDGSPEDPVTLIEEFKDRLSICYHRFPDNLGHKSLTAHWNRCVNQTDSDWVWLFSDDDVISTDCVSSFRKTLIDTGEAFDLYRFNTIIINADGDQIYRGELHPATETSTQIALARFVGNRYMFAQEHIFRRTRFQESGGFVDFPLAWFADDATWVTFAMNTGICTIPEGTVFWRNSGINISSSKPEFTDRKYKAFEMYMKLLAKKFPSIEFLKELREAVWRWCPDNVEGWGGRPHLITGLKFWLFLSIFTRHLNRRLLNKLLFS